MRFWCMERNSKHIALYIVLLLSFWGCACSHSATPNNPLMVVDIFNYFRQENIDTSLDIVSFVNKDTCLQLAKGGNGDYHCDFLKDKILMYYPDDYNIVFMLCEPPTTNNELYVYIDSSQYIVQPPKSFPVYKIDVFFSKFLYLHLQRGDTLFTHEKTITLCEEHLYEILDVVGEFLKVREVKYDETHIPRIISQPSNPIFLFRWRDGYNIYTERFVIDE